MFQVIDMHCDTIPALQWKEKQEHLADADLQINLDKLEKGGSLGAARIKQHKNVFRKRRSFGYAVSPFCRSISKDAGSIPTRS